MGHVRALRFESLEQRELLSGVRHVEQSVKNAVPATALVISGTLGVNNKAATMTMDDQGDTLTTTPVSGQLGSLGKVRGVWMTGTDQYGDYMGPDQINIHTTKGTFVIEFNENNAKVTRPPGGAAEYTDGQLAAEGTGAYAGGRESGTIEWTTNAARTEVKTMTLVSQGI